MQIKDMQQDDYFVVVTNILKTLYECLKRGKGRELTDISPERIGIGLNYWDVIICGLLENDYIEECFRLDGKGGQELEGYKIKSSGIERLYELAERFDFTV